jgi:hypothetical protein
MDGFGGDSFDMEAFSQEPPCCFEDSMCSDVREDSRDLPEASGAADLPEASGAADSQASLIHFVGCVTPWGWGGW